jgi:hypothetical protein
MYQSRRKKHEGFFGIILMMDISCMFGVFCTLRLMYVLPDDDDDDDDDICKVETCWRCKVLTINIT